MKWVQWMDDTLACLSKGISRAEQTYLQSSNGQQYNLAAAVCMAQQGCQPYSNPLSTKASGFLYNKYGNVICTKESLVEKK